MPDKISQGGQEGSDIRERSRIQNATDTRFLCAGGKDAAMA
jgi:hypothetical protein